MKSYQSEISFPKQASAHFSTDKLSEQHVEEFLARCGLGHYLPVFLDEGFDSIISLLEITEEDMIEMNVKRGHRRLIQRQISNCKGIAQDQPLVVNVLTTKNPSMYTPVKYESCKPLSSGYDTMVTGLTSPRSMSSAVLSGNTSGSSSDLVPPPTKKPSTREGDSQSSSMSSNDDNESIDTTDGLKRKYQRHPKPDRKAPIKPPSAYIMFSNNARASLKDMNLSFAELAKIVGDQWKNLSHAEKQNYERMAMRAKDEFLAALERYKFTPEYEEYQNYLKEFRTKQSSPSRNLGRRKRTKKEPSSGNSADVSSNGNSSNVNGSSGGSTDSSFIAKDGKKSSTSPDSENSWDYRCSQMMKGIIPVEFSEFNNDNNNNQSFLPSSSEEQTEGGRRRRSPRFNDVSQ